MPLSDIPDDYFFRPDKIDESLWPRYKVVIDPTMALTIRDRSRTRDPNRTLWVFRYYDLNERNFAVYGNFDRAAIALARVTQFYEAHPPAG